MSQFNTTLLKTVAITALFGSAVIPHAAEAAMTSSQGRDVVYKTHFNEVDGIDAAVLDWRNQSVEFTFDMEDADWTDRLELYLSADPLGRVSSRTPVMVQFNNGKPIPLVTRGQGFDTRIKLNKAKIRPRRNKVKFTYKTPSGEACLLPEHGGWRLNFKESFVVVKARAKSRNYYLKEVEARLANATTAPRSVSILARGQNTAKLQALAAQGIGIRMKTLPEFKTTKSNSEFEVVLGRRDELYGWVSDDKILNGTGPRVLVHEGRPMRLVITGDTDAEVMATASAFATRLLPTTQRRKTSLGEIQFQPAFKDTKTLIQGSAKISDIGGTYFEDGWGPKAKRIKFNVADPSVSQGELLLRLARNKNTDKDSRVSVNLNGQSLGYTKLDKARKSVAFDIPEGTLQGSDNLLTITPELNMAKASGCNFQKALPGFYLGEGSKIKIETPYASPVAELSKLTATGAPFSMEQGKNTLIILPAGSSRDYGASLKVLAQLARTSGSGWVNAEYMRSTSYAALTPKKNILFIGPSARFKGHLRNAAPKGLTSALKGKVLTGTGRKIASNDIFASNNESEAMRIYAARQTKAGRIGQGGVAALYPSPHGSGKVMGVITNVPGSSFSRTASQIVKPSHWNSLEGSVARWNNSNVLMAQTAMNVPGFASPKSKQLGLGELSSGFNLPKFDMPSLEGSFFDMQDFDPELAKERIAKFRTGLLTKIKGWNMGGSASVKPTQEQAIALRPSQIFNKKAATTGYVSPQTNMITVSVKNLRRSIINNEPKINLELRGFSKVRPFSQKSASFIGQSKSWIVTKANSLKNIWNSHKHATVNTETQPDHMMGTANTSKRRMSNSALLLILIFGGIFALMGLSVPSAGHEDRQ